MTSYTENGKDVGSESDQRINAHHIGEKRIFSTSDAPSYSHKERYEGNWEINPQANVEAQFPTQCVDSEGKKLAEDQMVSDEGSGAFPVH